jgi:hypothetical protein
MVFAFRVRGSAQMKPPSGDQLMNTNQVNDSGSGEKGKAREGAEKTADEETTPNKGKPGKHSGKDETVLGEINDDAKKKGNE